jgi:hypothetical protein
MTIGNKHGAGGLKKVRIGGSDRRLDAFSAPPQLHDVVRCADQLPLRARFGYAHGEETP